MRIHGMANLRTVDTPVAFPAGSSCKIKRTYSTPNSKIKSRFEHPSKKVLVAKNMLQFIRIYD
jgi:hypothetical protein